MHLCLGIRNPAGQRAKRARRALGAELRVTFSITGHSASEAICPGRERSATFQERLGDPKNNHDRS